MGRLRGQILRDGGGEKESERERTQSREGGWGDTDDAGEKEQVHGRKRRGDVFKYKSRESAGGKQTQPEYEAEFLREKERRKRKREITSRDVPGEERRGGT